MLSVGQKRVTLEEYISRFDITLSVMQTPDSLSRIAYELIEDVALELENTNLVVLPSYREGFPKALIEASACGRAIVTTDVPGCREAVEHKVNGLLVPKENPYELAKAVRYLIENKNERREMGLKSRIIAEDKYSINQVVDTHMKIYEEINRK